MDIQEICDNLTDRYPQWSSQINMLAFTDTPDVRPVENDGQRIYYNGRLMKYYTEEIQSFYIAQQILHLQFSHFARGSGKEQTLWKRASDAVVNAMLKADGFSIPKDAIQMPEAEAQSAEDLYRILLADQDEKEEEPDEETQEQRMEAGPQETDKRAGKSSEEHRREIEDPGLAAAIAGLSELLEPSMQMDFDWFPGSTIRDGMIRYEFRAYPVVHAEILLDTSASVDAELLRAFVRGVKGLFQQDAVIRVGCFDTRFYGFQNIQCEKDILDLELNGAGGTDFHAAVSAFTGDTENKIIFTDGFAEMPEQRCDAVWVVYGNTTIQPKGGRVLYVRQNEEKEKHEIDFLIT